MLIGTGSPSPGGLSGHLTADIKRGGVVLLCVLSIVFLLVRPLPPSVLDVLLTINLLISLVLLFRALLARQDADFASFPALLLFTTVFRLALNVSSSRLILLYGDRGSNSAGMVIEAFGSFMVQGDYLVGAIVFSIIAMVNLLVIARGAARVAEVAARFTLDTVPGKQFSIDSDLRSGAIDAEEALRRRARLVFESQFYGAMDGGMKFVQGDALACVIVALVNCFGGFGIGILRGLTAEESFKSFVLLAIGDGLINIIPALIVSTAAGLLVTRVAQRNERIFEQFVSQIMVEPSSVLFGGLGIVFLGVFSGFPFWPSFLVGGSSSLLLVWWIKQKASTQRGWHFAGLMQSESDLMLGRLILRDSNGLLTLAPLPHSGIAFSKVDRFPNSMESREQNSIASDSLVALEVDYYVMADYLFGRSRSVVALHSCYKFWDLKLFQDFGCRLRKLDIVLSKTLGIGEYRVLVRGREVRRGHIPAACQFVVANSQFLNLLGFKLKRIQSHPVSGVPGAWLHDSSESSLNSRAKRAEALEVLGAEIYDGAEFLALEVAGGVRDAYADFLDLEESRSLLAVEKSPIGHIIDNINANGQFSFAEWAEILRRLVSEAISIKDIRRIVDSVARYILSNKDLDLRPLWFEELYQNLRINLSLSNLPLLANSHRVIRVFLLEPNTEQHFRQFLDSWDPKHPAVGLDPLTERGIRIAAAKLFQPVMEKGVLPIVIICSADVRYMVNNFFAAQFGGGRSIRTLSFEELKGGYRIEPIGLLSYAWEQ